MKNEYSFSKLQLTYVVLFLLVATFACPVIVSAVTMASPIAQSGQKDDEPEEVDTDRDLSINVGDRVVVTANFETKIYREKVDKVFGGGIHTVIAIENDKWCALEDVKGWLPLQYVMNLEMAEKQYAKRIDANELDADAFAHRGMIHYENEQFISAFTDLNESLRVNKGNAATWNNRGIILNAQGKYVLAMKDIRYALKLNPKFPNAHYNLGLVYYAMGDNKKAVDSYNKAIELNPKNPWYVLSRGSAKLAMDDTKGAFSDYEKTIEINKRMADAFIGKSNVRLIEEDYDEAMKFANQAVKLQSKNGMALNARGWLYFKQDKFDEAMLDFDRAVRHAPRLPIAYNNRGVCNVAMERFDAAIKDYNRAMKLAGETAIGYSNRGTAYFGKGEYKKAEEDFQKALEMAPSLAEAANSMAWFRATCPDEAFRNGDEAYEQAKIAVEVSGRDDWNHLDTQAAAAAEKRDFDEAIQLAEKALSVAPAEKKSIIEDRIAQFKEKKPVRTKVGHVTKQKRSQP